MNNVTILDALKEEANDEILDYLQDNPDWRNTDYKNNMVDALFNDRDKFSRWAYIGFYDGLIASTEVREYVVAKEQNEVEKSVTGLDFFNSAWRFVGFDLVEEWDSLVEQ